MTEKEINKRLTEDFLFYIEHAPLMVKPKTGPLVPLKLNNAQMILHDAIEKQLATTGKVRIIVLKGRQQGVSTYVEARFYWITSRRHAISTFIITHLAKATENLFAMTKRYHENVDGRLQTPTIADSRNSLEFKGLHSDFKVATAGSAEIGRSFTLTNFHGSEHAFWPNPEAIAAGALQAVPNMPGTEVIFESTANGMNNDFYVRCKKAMHGEGEFELVFIPWFVQEEYRTTPPPDYKLTSEERKIAKKFDLDMGQMYWRHRKIEDEFSGKVHKFMQEYPCDPDEAFQSSQNTLIDIADIQKARAKESVEDFEAPLIMGIDPATKKDRAVIALRKGRNFKSAIIFDCEKEPMEPSELVQEIDLAIHEFKPDKVFIDKGEIGAAIASWLHDLGHRGLVIPVNFGQNAKDPERFENKRCEMWYEMGEFLREHECKLPDSDEVQADLLAMPDYFLNSSQRMQLISKQKIRDDFKLSTDIGDAFALTFAFPVNKNQRTTKRHGQIRHERSFKKPKVKRKTVKWG